jgi:predicted adenine nucleotide alpha hydrolase (AANH) superfamily ATPase
LKLLMHMCCSNCSLYPLQNFLSKGVDIRGFWFNPNIHPYREYTSRLASVEKLQHLWSLDVEYDDEYALDDFLAEVVNKGTNRCYFCYSLRLEKTALTARRMGLDGFTTSLLASPYQKFDMIMKIGEETGRRHSIPFHCEDVRQGWSVSRSLALELGLYRQKYCGCVYSEMERYRKKVKK